MAKKKEEQMSMSDFNLPRINTSELGEHISATIKLAGNLAVFGRRGTGKTEIAKQQIEAAGCEEIYMNLSVLERVDLGGYPDILGRSTGEAKNDYVKFLLPAFYEKMRVPGGRPVVALLDEVDKADPSLWAPLLEFVQFHTINGTPLPNLRTVIMTGNLIAEGGNRPSLPLLDRTEKYMVHPDVNSWMWWAGQRGKIHPSITAFINDHPNELFGNVDPADRYADPSPRAWTRASHILNQGEELKWSNDMLNAKVNGCVGMEAGLKFRNYFAYYQDLVPMVQDVFDGKDIQAKYNSKTPSEKLVLAMITCSRFSSLLDSRNDKQITEKNEAKLKLGLKNIPTFLKYVSPEITLVAVRSQIHCTRIARDHLIDDSFWKKILVDVQKQTI
jgi:hypothetical protein